MDASRATPTVEVLSRDACLELLASLSIGRIAVATPEGPPLVVPVNYVFDGEAIVFRTDPGAKLDGLRDHAASFQVDRVDPIDHSGWSVLVQGFAFETSPIDLDLDSWDPGPKRHWVRIFPGRITGRRLWFPVLATDARGYL